MNPAGPVHCSLNDVRKSGGPAQQQCTSSEINDGSLCKNGHCEHHRCTQSAAKGAAHLQARGQGPASPPYPAQPLNVDILRSIMRTQRLAGNEIDDSSIWSARMELGGSTRSVLTPATRRGS